MKLRVLRLLPLISIALLAACEEEPAAAARGGWGGAAKVVTQQVELQHIVDEIEALGTAHANESIEIQPRISSLIEAFEFEEGQLVEAGQRLVQLEDNEIVAGLRLAEANLSESRSLYNRSQSLADTQAISASNLEQLLARNKACLIGSRCKEFHLNPLIFNKKLILFSLSGPEFYNGFSSNEP